MSVIGPKTRAVLALFADPAIDWLSNDEIIARAGAGGVAITADDIEVLIGRGYLQRAYASGFMGAILTEKGREAIAA